MISRFPGTRVLAFPSTLGLSLGLGAPAGSAVHPPRSLPPAAGGQDLHCQSPSWRPAQLSSGRPPNPDIRASLPPHLLGEGPRLWEEGTCDWGLKNQARLEMRLGSFWKPLCRRGAWSMLLQDGVGCLLGGERTVGRQEQEQGPFSWAGGAACWLGLAVA